MDSVHDDRAGVEPITGLCRFRDGFYSCLGARADAQFELTEALLCADGPVRSLVDLSLAPEHRRGHGALYDGLNHGSIEVARLRRGVAGAAAAAGRGPDRAGRRRLAVAASGRRDQRGTAVLPRPRPGQGHRADDPGLAVLGRGRAGVRAQQLDRGAGRGPPRPRRRRDRGDRRPAARGRGSAARGRALAPGRPGPSGSCSTPATTSPGWRSCWPTCR